MPAAPHGQAPGQGKKVPTLWPIHSGIFPLFQTYGSLCGERVEYATDEIELVVTLHAPGVFSGLFGKFFAAEVHVSPLHERGNKYQTAQTFPGRGADIHYWMEPFS
jgi:hypothetical protein